MTQMIQSPPRCVVCGGPDESGGGCEFCPSATLERALERIALAADPGRSPDGRLRWEVVR